MAAYVTKTNPAPNPSIVEPAMTVVVALAVHATICSRGEFKEVQNLTGAEHILTAPIKVNI
jgi:hypothetical protein